MDLRVEGLDELKDRLNGALDTLAEYQLGTRINSDEFFSQPFMQDHTEFDSFRAFYQQSPWALESPSEIQQVPSTQLDEYVSNTTDFETWEEMKTKAAEEALLFDLLS